jgi:hypothetical protein
MENTETVPQKVVDQKTIVLKSRLDKDAAKLLGENKKTDFFKKIFFLKPRAREISLISFSKYYEPLVVIGGKYSIDYCKKHVLELKTNNKVQSIFVGGEEMRATSTNFDKNPRIFRITGEEHAHYENETYFLLDRVMREISPDKFHLAPFENTNYDIESDKFDFKKINFSLEDEIVFLRSRLVSRPANAEWIIREIFEINDRLIIYSPVYELTFQNSKTSRVLTMLVDGVTGQISVVDFIKANDKTDSQKTAVPKGVEKVERIISQESENEISKPIINSSDLIKPMNEDEKNSTQRKKSFPKNFKTKSRSKAEDAMDLALDSLKRLGLREEVTPVKVSGDGELFSVELSLQNKIAKVLVNTETKEIKEYEIQEASANF